MKTILNKLKDQNYSSEACTLIDSLCCIYYNETDKRTDILRKTQSEPHILDLLHLYTIDCIENLKNNNNEKSLIYGLVAVSIINLNYDYREILINLDALYCAAKTNNENPMLTFKEVGKISSNKSTNYKDLNIKDLLTSYNIRVKKLSIC